MNKSKNIIEIADLYIIFFSGSTKAEALAIEFDVSKSHIVLPHYRLN